LLRRQPLYRFHWPRLNSRLSPLCHFHPPGQKTGMMYSLHTQTRHLRGHGLSWARNWGNIAWALWMARRRKDQLGLRRCGKFFSYDHSYDFLQRLWAQAVCVTACGNFGIGSSSMGEIYMWNMQSGIKRKSFSIGACPPEVNDRFRPSTTKKGSERCVTGLASDSLNRMVIASTMDGTINVRLSSLYPT
jgi:hypothetical protein